MPEIGRIAERRAAPRYVLNMKGTAEVLYRRSPVPAGEGPVPGNARRFPVETVNISESGLMVSFSTELSEGDFIRLSLARPGTPGFTDVEAHIQWMRRNRTSIMGKFLAGLAFRNPPKGLVESLLAYAISQAGRPPA